MKTQLISLTGKEIKREVRKFFEGTAHEKIVEIRHYTGGGAVTMVSMPEGLLIAAQVPPEGGDSVRPAPTGEDRDNPPKLPGAPS